MRAQVSHGAPYRHFAEPGAAPALEAAGRAYLDFARSRTGMYRLMFTSDILEGNPEPEIGRMSREAYRQMGAVVAALIPGSGQCRAAAALIWAQLRGLALLLMEGRIRPRMREGVEDSALCAAACRALPHAVLSLAPGA